MGTNTSSLARASALPMVLSSILSAEDSDEIIEIAERDGWNLALDSVDGQPAWEKNLAKHRIGERVVIRMRNAISRVFPNVTLTGYKLYVRKFAPEIPRISSGPHGQKPIVGFAGAERGLRGRRSLLHRCGRQRPDRESEKR